MLTSSISVSEISEDDVFTLTPLAPYAPRYAPRNAPRRPHQRVLSINED